jgi:hypothetical protein
MTEFKLIFIGRLRGEGGKLQRYAVTGFAIDRQAAVLSLFKAYSDIRIISTEEVHRDPITACHGHAEDRAELRTPGRA